MLGSDLALGLDPAMVMTTQGLMPDDWQATLLRARARRALLLCSRQSGKSTVAAAMGIHEALYHPPALVIALSPGERQSGELFSKIVESYQALNEPVRAESATALKLQLVNGSRVVALPGQEGTVRGFSGVKLLLIDEAARVPDPLYKAVRPMLAVSGGRLVAMSTPFGKRGWFFEEWENGGPAWQRVKVTAEQCPRIPESFLADELRSLGRWWYEQEYLCKFKESTDAVFSFDDIEAAISSDVLPLFGGVR